MAPRSSRRRCPRASRRSTGRCARRSDLGIAKIDFKTDTIGWAQSEKEANPFRIASTKSQVEAAKAKGWKLLTTNAQSNVQQENSDIKGMIDKGAKAIIFSPINSTGLGDAIAYAKEKKVAMIPVDRNITGVKGCQEVGPQLGSDFVEQGKRAADAMIKATGGKAKLAILLGASGVNVTDDRTSRLPRRAQGQERDRHQGRLPADRRLHPGEGQERSPRPLLAVPPGHQRDLRRERRDGPRRPGRPERRRQGRHAKVHIVSIDGTKGAVQAIVDGNFDAVIESNPAFGPSAQAALEAYVNGDGAPAVTITTDNQYDSTTPAGLDSGTAY